MDLPASRAPSTAPDSLEATMPQGASSREKSKRPQLSCNACRTRKVKCDRIQPCTACSLHQVAGECVYDLSESERHPILQAEALREKDKEIAKLRLEIASLGGPSTRHSASISGGDVRKRRKADSELKSPKNPSTLKQKRPLRDGVCEEKLSQLKLCSADPALQDRSVCGVAMDLFNSTSSCPFGISWVASKEASGLVAILPNREEIIASYKSLQNGLQTCSLPILSAERSPLDLNHLLASADEMTENKMDVLAFVFAMLAQSVLYGAYDHCKENWVAGTMENSLNKGDIYLAAAMQALRLASFSSKPTLLIIQTLALVGSYLTDSGRFLDSAALFGITIRLSQVLELHRDPSALYLNQDSSEVNLRRALWWWMLQADQHYSVTLSLPLAVSTIGDCSPPDPSCFPPGTERILCCYLRFNVLARGILVAGNMRDSQIDDYTDQLASLLASIPVNIRFRPEWLNPKFETPPWPVDSQAASLHQQIHNYIVLLNRQRNTGPLANPGDVQQVHDHCSTTSSMPHGNERIFGSCREILKVFEYFSSRQKRGWINWSVCQQAYNAATVLAGLIPKPCEAHDRTVLLKTYQSFLEIHQLGIHTLAGPAAKRLEDMVAGFRRKQEHSVHVLCDRDDISANHPDLPHPARNNLQGSVKRGANGMRPTQKPYQDNHSKSDFLHSASVKKAKLTNSNSKTKGARGSSSKRVRGKEPLPLGREGLTNLSNEFRGPERANAPSNASIGSNEASASQQNRSTQSNLSSPCTTALPFSAATAVSQHQQPSSVSMSRADAYVLDQFLSDRRASFASGADLQAFVPLVSPTTQTYQGDYPSETPSLSAHSYPSSVYNSSVPSSLHTPSASHPVSPLLGHRSLGIMNDGQNSYCGTQPITQQRNPPWALEVPAGVPGSDCLVANSNVLEQQDDVRWVWSNSTSW